MSSIDSVKTAAENSLDSVTLDFTTNVELATDAFLKEVLRALTPNALVTLTVPAANKSVKRNLLFSGFVEVQATSADGTTTLTAKKPALAPSAAQPVKLTAAVTADTEGEWGWGVDTTSTTELVDEAGLLKDDVANAPTFDCGTGTGPRKACKNCTCGLAQQEQAAAEANAPAPTGGCGNCALGDAFRCATCPSLGLPAWKSEGDKVKLDL